MSTVEPLLAVAVALGGLVLGRAFSGQQWLREKRLEAYGELVDALADVLRRLHTDRPTAQSLWHLEASDDTFARLDRARTRAALVMPPYLIRTLNDLNAITERLVTKSDADLGEFEGVISWLTGVLAEDLRRRSWVYFWQRSYRGPRGWDG